MWEKGQLARLASIDGQQPDLRLILPLFALFFTHRATRLTRALRGKGQPVAIRRPDRIVGIGWSAGKATSLAARGGAKPDGGTIFVLVLIDLGNDIGHMLSIG